MDDRTNTYGNPLDIEEVVWEGPCDVSEVEGVYEAEYVNYEHGYEEGHLTVQATGSKGFQPLDFPVSGQDLVVPLYWANEFPGYEYCCFHCQYTNHDGGDVLGLNIFPEHDLRMLKQLLEPQDLGKKSGENDEKYNSNEAREGYEDHIHSMDIAIEDIHEIACYGFLIIEILSLNVNGDNSQVQDEAT